MTNTAEKLEPILPESLTPEWNVENLDAIYAYWMRTGGCLLSPYPKGYDENLAWRYQLLQRAQHDELYRAKVKKLFFSDPLFAFNAFFYTLDVRRRPRHDRPFTTYPYQDLMILTTIDHIERGEDLAEEKSRDMGASWIKIACITWLWLKPEGGYDFLMGSRIENYVDKKGDMRTLFQKVRYLLKRLPVWLLPKGFNARKHDHFMRLLNPASGSSITGESNNANFSTGGRYRGILMDEFGKWKDTDEAAWTATADATPCRMPVSTPFGAFGQYFQVITDGKTKKLTIHWSLHPLKSDGLYCVYPKPKDLPEGKEINWLQWKGEKAWLRSKWYDKECARRNVRTIAQELDIDYIGAGSPVFDGIAAARILSLIRSERKPVKVFPFDIEYQRFLEPVDADELVDFENHLVVWKEPTQISQELFGVDVVEGKEHGDFAVITGIDRQTMSVGISFYGRCDEVLLANGIKTIDDWISERKYVKDGNEESDFIPWWGIEVNGPGLSTFDRCVDPLGMTNLFMTPNFDTVREQVVYQKGWRTGPSSRKKLVGAIKEWLIDGRGWACPRAAREMTSFVYKSPGRAEAASGANDDEVIALGIALVLDEMIPGNEWEPPEEFREDGLSVKLFERFPVVQEKSIEERCFDTATKIRNQSFGDVGRNSTGILL